MVLLCQRMLPAGAPSIFMQGELSFTPSLGTAKRRRRDERRDESASNTRGSTVLADAATKLRRFSFVPAPVVADKRATQDSLIRIFCSEANRGAAGLAAELNLHWPDLLVVEESAAACSACDHMLIYLNAHTWSHAPGKLAADIGRAQRMGLHTVCAHEFPSVVDHGSARGAIDFKNVIDGTPPHLKSGDTDLYEDIAVPLKAGE